MPCPATVHEAQIGGRKRLPPATQTHLHRYSLVSTLIRVLDYALQRKTSRFKSCHQNVLNLDVLSTSGVLNRKTKLAAHLSTCPWWLKIAVQTSFEWDH